MDSNSCGRTFRGFTARYSSFVARTSRTRPCSIRGLPSRPFTIKVGLLVTLTIKLITKLLIAKGVEEGLGAIQGRSQTTSCIQRNDVGIAEDGSFCLCDAMSGSTGPGGRSDGNNSDARASSSNSAFNNSDKGF